MTSEPTNERSERHDRERAGLFAATQWSVVLRAQKDSQAALNTLFGQYRQPLLVYLRSCGRTPHDAEDIVQGFYLTLLRRGFLKNIAQEKGRFRTFLLRSIKHYLIDLHRGERTPLAASLDETDAEGRSLKDTLGGGTTADVEFDRACAQALLAKVLRRLEAEVRRTRHAGLWPEIEPVLMNDTQAAAYSQIGAKVGVAEGAVKVLVHRIRARFYGLVREEVLQTVANESDGDEELRYFASLFARWP